MKFLDVSSHPSLCFRHRSARGDYRHVIVMRATFDIGRDGALTPKSPQPAINFEEKCFGEMLVTAPRDESHLAPEKPNVDVIVHANAYAPQARPCTQFAVELSIRDPRAPDGRNPALRCARRIVVTGPREWRYGGLFGSWTLSDPAPVLEVPLRFDLAYGGSVRLDDPERAYPRPAIVTHDDNPIGRGFVPNADEVAADCGIGTSSARTLLEEWSERNPRIGAPQIERAEQPLTSIDDRPLLAGWGVVAKHWASRYRYAGTYDGEWAQKRYPLLPDDFDVRFWNAAVPELQLDELAPGSVIELSNLVPVARTSSQKISVRVPELAPTITLRDMARPSAERHPLPLDTVIVDLIDDELTLLYRVDVPDTLGLAWIELEVTE